MHKLTICNQTFQIASLGDLNDYERYRFARYRRFVYQAYHRFNVPVPQILIINDNKMQMMSTTNGVYLGIYLGELDDLSEDSLKSSTYHELGHYFADKIIREHHLFHVPINYQVDYWLCLWSYNFSLKILSISLIFCIFLMIAAKQLSTAYIVSIPTIILFIAFIIDMIHICKSIPLNNVVNLQNIESYQQLCEIVADEFALNITHNLTSCYRTLDAPLDFYLYKYRQDRLHNPLNSHRMYKTIIVKPGAVHPSVKYRFKCLEHFQNSGYRKWGCA